MTRNLSTTYATVASSLALLVALGGTSYAVTQIGTAQLKNNAVTSPKIKNGAVTGADVKESSLAKVPSAATADALAGGTRIKKISYRSGDVTDAALVSFGELNLTITCGGGAEILTARTTTMDNEFTVSSVEADNLSQVAGTNNDTFGPASTVVFPRASGNSSDREYSFTFTAASGKNVTGVIMTEDELGSDNCIATGYLVG